MKNSILKRTHAGNRVIPVQPFLGASPRSRGVDFRLFARHASRVWLMIFKRATDDEPMREIELSRERDRMGDIWHVYDPKARPGQFYLYRLEGDPAIPDAAADPTQWILDPYAPAVSGAPSWGSTFGLAPGRFPRRGAQFPKGIIVDQQFDWEDDVPLRTPLDELVIYEAHVRNFTAHESSGVRHPGTYAGFIEKIPYLKELGINAVELMPVQEFDEMEYHHDNGPRKALRNLWGYSTVNYFSPNGRYAAAGNQGGQVAEFKELVKALHRAGIEVILDIVLNHTAEGGAGGRTLSFRGIEPTIYYLLTEDGKHFRNYTGCGNTVNTNHPVVIQFILDVLRHWVTNYHVDGFRFDLASVFARGPDGEVMSRPPVLEAISEDPVLRGVKLIAEAWDAVGLYQVGSFPCADWSEWNGRFRDDVRRYWSGAPGGLSGLASRLAGSADLYAHHGKSPLKSINFATSHDGFPLADLVSYNEKHNDANAEGNRDGEQHNLSFNNGVEGPTDDVEIVELRYRLVKSFFATVLCAQGVPMLLAGDEVFRTQQGNNNAYCQDNEISWLDWTLKDRHPQIFRFVTECIALRKSHPALRRKTFLAGNRQGQDTADVLWLGADGQDPNWAQAGSLACLLNGARHHAGADRDHDHLLLCFNAHRHSVRFHLPPPPASPWTVRLSAEEPSPTPDKDRILDVGACTVTVLASHLKSD